MKRSLDIIIAISAMILLSPLLLTVAVLVRIKLDSPVIFKQNRPGMNGKIFTLYKFKTLLDLYDDQGNMLPDEERMTPFGDFLRSFSLDELPQFWNVIRGDMSAIGPRPQMEKYWRLLTDEQKEVFNIKPGITGWAQINGRNLLSWEKRFEMDLWYLENWSIWLDIKIAFITIWKVIKREGIKHPGCATMVEFTGNSGKTHSEQWRLESVDNIEDEINANEDIRKINQYVNIDAKDYN